MKNISIHMVRPHFEDLPTFDAPSGYALRTYQPGDEHAWKQIHIEADPYNTFTDETFVREFGSDKRQWEENQFYLINAQNRPVGTATAWSVIDKRDCEEGLVHWVALLPDLHGNGLSKPLMSAVCHRLNARGFTRAYLTTSSGRMAAVGLYLSFGFKPDIRKAGQREAWLHLRDRLGAHGQLIDNL